MSRSAHFDFIQNLFQSPSLLPVIILSLVWPSKKEGTIGGGKINTWLGHVSSYLMPLMTDVVVVFIFRCANQRTHARTRPTTVTNMLNAFTSVTSVTPCTSVSVGLVTLEMASFVEKTQTWMAGPIRTLCVVLTPHITARRYCSSLCTAVADIKPVVSIKQPATVSG